MYVVTTSKVNNDTGEVKVSGGKVDINVLWDQQARIAMAPSPFMGMAAVGIFASMPSPVFGLSYTLEGSFKQEIPKEAFNLADLKVTFPELSPISVHTPVITGFKYDNSTRLLVVSAENLIPPDQSPGNFKFQVWLMPRGEQISSPSAQGTKLDRGMIWQGFDAFNASGGKLRVKLPDHLALSMHDIYVQRISSGTANGESVTIFPSNSDPLEGWSLGTDDTLVTTAHSIDVFRAGEKIADQPLNVADLSLVAKVTEDEDGKPLNFVGRYTDQIAYSNDGTLAYIAGGNSSIYVFDTQTRSVVHTLHVKNSTVSLTSLAVVDGWLYVTEGSAYGETGGRLVRFNIDQLSIDFLNEKAQQVVLFDKNVVIAPYGFQDMAVNNGSYLALTAPQSPDRLIGDIGSPKGNVYVLDLGKIEKNGKAGTVVSIGADKFTTKLKGKFPQYISSGQNDGEFLLSSGKSNGYGLIGLTVGVNDQGNLIDDDVTMRSTKLNPQSSGTKSNDYFWRRETFQQDIQRSSGNAIVTYMNKEYALVADYNFVFNYPDWMNYMVNKQIGGKIGVIEDPFGKSGGPKYLGATTPIVGGAVDHLTLSPDGRLYADVFVDEPTDTGSRSYKALFIWDAARLIQDALDARTDNALFSQPIDKKKTFFDNYEWRSGAPARFNGTGTEPDDYFGWTYGIGAYIVPGRPTVVSMVNANYTPIAIEGEETNILRQQLEITVEQIDQQRRDGTYSAASYLAKEFAYDGINLVMSGGLDRQAEIIRLLEEDKLDGTAYWTATSINAVVSVLGLVGATRAYELVSSKLVSSKFGVFSGGGGCRGNT